MQLLFNYLTSKLLATTSISRADGERGSLLRNCAAVLARVHRLPRIRKNAPQHALQKPDFLRREAGEGPVGHLAEKLRHARRNSIARGRQLETHRAAILVAAHAREKLAFFEAVDEPGHCARVDAVMAREVGRGEGEARCCP